MDSKYVLTQLSKETGIQKAYIKELEAALYQVLDSSRLDIAKENAAEALDVELEEYLNKDLDVIDFMDNEFNGEVDYSLMEDEING